MKPSDNIYKTPIIVALLSLALAVVIGAFGAHMLADRISAHYMDIYGTGSHYHYIHSIGWLVVLLLCMHAGITQIKWINILFLSGLILFCGSLYLISFNELLEMPGLRTFGALAPIGGVAFVGAWLLSAFTMYRRWP